MEIFLLNDRAIRTMITLMTVLQVWVLSLGAAEAAPSMPAGEHRSGLDFELVELSLDFQRLSIATSGGCEWAKRPVGDDAEPEIVTAPEDREFNLAFELWMRGEIAVAEYSEVVQKIGEAYLPKLPRQSGLEELIGGVLEGADFAVAEGNRRYMDGTNIVALALEARPEPIAAAPKPIEAIRPHSVEPVVSSEILARYLSDAAGTLRDSLAEIEREFLSIAELAGNVGSEISYQHARSSWHHMRAELEAMRRSFAAETVEIQDFRPIERIAIEAPKAIY